MPSKWETVDPSDVQAQAVTSSKWDLFENENKKSITEPDNEEDEEDVDGERNCIVQSISLRMATRLKEKNSKPVANQSVNV